MTFRHLALALQQALIVLLAFSAGEVLALDCDKTDSNAAIGENVECVVEDTTDPDNTEDVNIEVTQDITVTGGGEHGIYGRINERASTQDIDITVRNATIMTDRTVGTNTATLSYGIYSRHEGARGDTDIETSSITVSTKGNTSHGVYGVRSFGAGHVDIHFRNSMVTTDGETAYGIYGWIQNSNNTRNLNLRVNGSTVTTKGTASPGVVGRNGGSGDTIIGMTSTTVTTESTALSGTSTDSYGVYGYHQHTGDIIIDARLTSINTKGTYSYGIYGDHHGSGDISITTRERSAITTTGPNADGITAYQRSTSNPGDIAISVDGTIDASGSAAHGVRVGRLAGTNVSRVAPIGADGYRRQTVTVHGDINGGTGADTAGIRMVGGGKVFIGAQGVVRARSGLAIHAVGNAPGEGGGADLIKPDLLLDMRPGGRTMATVFPDGGWIVNEGGVTTIIINEVTLHDKDGNTDNTAINGAWDVTLRDGSKNVTARTAELTGWTIADLADRTAVDRDFSSADFLEEETDRAMCEPYCLPPPPPAVVPQIPDTPEPEEPEMQEPQPPGPTLPPFVEVYGPRAALYEALPDFMVRLQHQAPARIDRSRSTWLSFTGVTGDYDFERSTVGSRYDAERLVLEAGAQYNLSKTLALRAALHHRRARGDVSSSTLGGRLRAQGTGISVDLDWNLDTWYTLAHAAYTNYDTDITSDTRGRLKSNIGATGHSLHLEVGQQNKRWSPRAWLNRTGVSIDSFTDAVGAEASFSSVGRTNAGLGLLHHADTWHASLDLSLGSNRTRTTVSGEDLVTKGAQTRVQLGLAREFRIGPLQIHAEVSAREALETGSTEYSVQLGVL